MFKKVLAGVLAFGLTASIVGGSSAFAEDGFHEGEQPLRTYVSEETGVTVDVFAKNPSDVEAIKKERGWQKHEFEKVKNPTAQEAIKKNKIAQAFESALNKTTLALIQNFGTIKASAHTDTSGWDRVGREAWYVTGNYSKKEIDTLWHSHGGDYMFRMPAHDATAVKSSSPSYGWSPHMYVELWEWDVGSGDRVTAWNVFPSRYTLDYRVNNIGGWVDGAEAEFRTHHYTNYTSYNNVINGVEYYD